MTIRTFDYDDYPRDKDRMFRVLDGFKERYPGFRCTVFAVPTWMNRRDWRPLERRREWIEVGIHGIKHGKAECRDPAIYQPLLPILEKALADRRYTKVFKAAWYGVCEPFLTWLNDRDVVPIVKRINYLPVPAPVDISVVHFADLQFLYSRTSHLDEGRHVDSHPIYIGEQSRLKTKATEISERNIASWTKTWALGDEWRFIREYVGPASCKLHLACGPQVWDGWRNCDMRTHLDARIVPWCWPDQIPCTSHRADVVMSSHFFEYLAETDYRLFCCEVWRVMRPHAIWRISDREGSRYTWRPIGYRSRGTGEIKSHPTRESITAALEHIGFKVSPAVPGKTLSPCQDVLLGDTRARAYRLGRKFYLEAEKDIDITWPRFPERQDKRISRRNKPIVPTAHS